MSQAAKRARLQGTFDGEKVLERERGRVAARRHASREAYLTPTPTCYVKSVDGALKARDRLLGKYFRAIDAEEAAERPDGVAGLALSGGGVRSATFNLGVLQRLDELGILQKLDYLSTVSGGGYIGGSLTACITADARKAFPFHKRQGADQGESFILRHLRRSSSYLVARGWLDALVAVLALLGGMLANILVLLPFLLLFAILAMLPARLLDAAISIRIAITAVCVALLTAFVYVLLESGKAAAERSWKRRESLGRFAAKIGGAGLLVAFLALQPVLLEMAESALDKATVPNLWAMVSGGGLAWGILSVAGSMLASPILRRPALAFSLVALALLLVWILIVALGIGMLSMADGKDVWWVANAGLLVSLALIGLIRFLPINCGSLHSFYRDRLSKAYFFKPNEPGDRSLDHFDDCQLSGIDVEHAPYLLINACLNVSDAPSRDEDLPDDYVRPGRRGAFFLFSREAVGNDSLGYISTNQFEKENRLNGSLATAMAISGAAFGANMGYNTNSAAVLLLTMLNVRTARWIKFPDCAQGAPQLQRLLGDFAYLTLTREAVSRFDNRSGSLLLSDGGHIDNLGLYQLFKRHCSLVIASDAEADPSYNFEGLAAAVRLAKIDLNVQVEIDYAHLAAIREGKRHFAVGEIRYPDGPAGTLIYLKSSLTDEALRDVSLLNYRRANATFPHETTANQFFSEQQFEAYRSLGYVVCERTFEGPGPRPPFPP